ncbi:MAG: response regulator [Candidatus Sedimenticola sp. (ex Thyasira tokunagai)]
MRSFFKKNSSAPEGVPGTEKTVLVVDDSPTETHIIKGIVEKGGYSVITAEDGESGVAEAKQTHPDVILMDVVMPGLNGFQATRQLTRAPETADIPVILVTTKDQDTDRAWGMRQGAKDYVVKPVTAADLLQKIKSVLES